MNTAEDLRVAVDRFTDGTATQLDVIEAAERWRHDPINAIPTADAPRCAWCDDVSWGWAKVEPGYGTPHPSCGVHGAEFSPYPVPASQVAESDG